jgi:hypothetical protein
VVVVVRGVVVEVVADESDGDGAVVGGVVVVVVVVNGVVVVVEFVETVLVVALLPGCSLATTTPITAVAPVAIMTAERVRRRTRTVALCRASGVWLAGDCVMG